MTKVVVQNAEFISFTCMRSHPWIMLSYASVHGCAVQD